MKLGISAMLLFYSWMPLPGKRGSYPILTVHGGVGGGLCRME